MVDTVMRSPKSGYAFLIIVGGVMMLFGGSVTTALVHAAIGTNWGLFWALMLVTFVLGIVPFVSGLGLFLYGLHGYRSSNKDE